MTWYNKYRPLDFDDVIGQATIKEILTNSLNAKKIKHAYLFVGTRGVGKTTLARIFANKLTGGSKVDIIELDAASNTGIDDIRNLQSNAQTPPLQADYKVFIIDEVHMLSKSAMNALLKILEEPPEHLVFLLATTDPQKILPTVLSRLTRLNLSNHSMEELIDRLKYIIKEEGINFDKESLELIAKRADGSQRNSINLLETIASYGLKTNTLEKTREILGLLPEETFVSLNRWLNDSLNETSTKELIQKFSTLNIDSEILLKQSLDYFLDQSLLGEDHYDLGVLVLSKALSSKVASANSISLLAYLGVLAREQGGLEKKSLKIGDYKDSGQLVDNSKNGSINKPVDNYDNLELECSKKNFIDTNLPVDKPVDNSKIDKEIIPARKEEKDYFVDKQLSTKTSINTRSVDKRLSKIELNRDVFTKDNNLSKKILDLQNDFSAGAAYRITKGIKVEAVDNSITFILPNPIPKSHISSSNFKIWLNSKLPETKEMEIKVKIEGEIVRTIKMVQNSDPKESLKKVDIRDRNHFYKVYKKLPDNMKGKGIKVFDGEIPLPEYQENDDDIFELE